MSHEPAGQQDVWHDHLHVFPRWMEDGLYAAQCRNVGEALRAQQATRVWDVLAEMLRGLPMPRWTGSR